MNLTSQTILITGATSGIGLHLATRLHQAGNKVIISGRNEKKLQEIVSQWADMSFIVCDVRNATQREALAQQVVKDYPQLNLVINNAGIMQLHDLTAPLDADRVNAEIETNLAAPVHLSSLLVQHLQQQATAAIVNVTSGLGFTPLAKVPVYSATKAAMHSFCISLRHQLKNTAVKVFEIVPPAVETRLGEADGYDKTNDQLMPVEEFVSHVVEQLQNDVYETGIGIAENLRQQRDALFEAINQ